MSAANSPTSVRLPGLTRECIDLVAVTYGMTMTQVIILAVDRLTRELNPEDTTFRSARAKAEAQYLAATGKEDGEILQA